MSYIITTNSRNLDLKPEESYENLSDEALVKLIVDQNTPLLFGYLYDRYANKVYSKCYSFSKTASEAKDLTQDVFLQLYLKLGTFQGKSKFSTWLYALTYNFCTNYVNRDRQRKMDHKLTDTIEEESNDLTLEIPDESLFQMRVGNLKKALNLITPEDKSLLLLKYQDDVSVKELVTLLGIGESAVKMRLKRAKSRVLKEYNKIR